MPPVFNKFNPDDTIDVDWIPKYAKYLKESNIQGVLVNGTTGEGPSLSVNERKIVAEKWMTCCKELDIHCMVNVGGAPYPDVVTLTKHAAQIEVNSLLCLPELYFKPKTEEELVEYINNVSLNAPKIPILYYHYPLATGVNLNMPCFIRLAKERIRTFGGIKYTSGDLEHIAPCAGDSDIGIFIGSEPILCSALAMGFDSSIMTTLNIFPELPQKIAAAVNSGDLKNGRKYQQELTLEVQKILSTGPWVPAMKAKFNEVMKTSKLIAGNVRFPLKTVY